MNSELEFLKEFQQELKTQDKDSQAAPRFWVIRDYKWEPTGEDWAETYHYFDGENTWETEEEFVQYLEEEFSSNYSSEICDFDDLEELMEDINKQEGTEFCSIPVKEEGYVVNNTMFLTKQEAKDHLENNHYHYTSKAHTFAMTAWRSPKVERLLEILENYDFGKLREAE